MLFLEINTYTNINSEKFYIYLKKGKAGIRWIINIKNYTCGLESVFHRSVHEVDRWASDNLK